MDTGALKLRLHHDLGDLAVRAGWSIATSYEDVVEDAMDAEGVTSLPAATAAQLARIRSDALRRCLVRLQLHYATLVDVTDQGRAEMLSQISTAISRLTAAGGGVAVARGFTLTRGAAIDYTTGEGDASE